MINTPGAQAQANKHAGRNRPSDIDELRDNIADIRANYIEALRAADNHEIEPLLKFARA